MKTWVLITLLSIVLATVGTAVALVVIYLKKRRKLLANSAYQESIVNQGVVTQALATQTQIVRGAVSDVEQTLGDVQDVQDGTFSDFSQTNKDLQDLQKNLAEASAASEALSAQQTAQDTSEKAGQALQGAQKDLTFYQKTRDTIKANTAKAIQTITKDLKEQAAALAKFKNDLQNKTVQEASLVNNPSITPPTLDSKPSIRTVWDAATQFLLASPPADVAIKRLAEIYSITNKDAVDLKKAAAEYAKPSKCETITRISIDGKWACPPGWNDTGRNWGDVDGVKQCTRGPCPALAPNKCGYTRRVAKGTGFGCPFGYKDTGRPATSDYQCSVGPCGATPPDPPTPCVYSARVATPKGWACPEGMIDTGLNWGDVDGGTKQCRTASCPQPVKKPLPPPAPAPSPSPSPAPSPSSGGCPSGGWMSAMGSVYSSYPKAGSKEGSEYSGDKWAGLFSYINGRQSLDWVKSNNIVAVFNSRNGRNDSEMMKNYANRTLWVRNKKNGTCMKVKVVDTCGDSDCKGCCTRNANAGGGMLIDFEKFTAQRFFGSGYKEENGEPANFEMVEWQFA
jgi:hypothetical protein